MLKEIEERHTSNDTVTPQLGKDWLEELIGVVDLVEEPVEIIVKRFYDK